MNPRGYIRVRTDDHPIPGDWIATCRMCGESILTGDWDACMEWAHGHLAFTHQADHPECTHEYGWHPVDRPEEHKCLDCGTPMPVGAR